MVSKLNNEDKGLLKGYFKRFFYWEGSLFLSISNPAALSSSTNLDLHAPALS